MKGEFKKTKPPTIDGEAKEASKAQLININKYFHIYEYDDNLNARLEIY